jgi:hypothetical protein
MVSYVKGETKTEVIEELDAKGNISMIMGSGEHCCP